MLNFRLFEWNVAIWVSYFLIDAEHYSYENVILLYAFEMHRCFIYIIEMATTILPKLQTMHELKLRKRNSG